MLFVQHLTWCLPIQKSEVLWLCHNGFSLMGKPQVVISLLSLPKLAPDRGVAGWLCNRLSPFHGWLFKVIWLSGSTMHSLAIQCCKCVCMPVMSDGQTFCIDVFHFITTILMVLIFLVRVYICIDMPYIYSYVLAISKEQKTHIIYYRSVPRLS